MKAVVYDRYGPPGVLRIEDVEEPRPKSGELLVNVRATSLNASDVEFLTGSPAYIRMMFGLTKPKFRILGSDVAGTVEALGPGVSGFDVGDAVVGDVLGTFGGFAERACVPAEAMTRIPEGMSFEDASTLPQAACVALQGLRDVGQLKEGEHALINGAGGGSGTFAIQIAKHLGAEITAVDNADKQDLMRELGADHVVDYAREDFTRHEARYDLILDFVSVHFILAYRRPLRRGGRYLVVGGNVRHLLPAVTLGPLSSRVSSRKLGMLVAKPNQGLDEVLKMVDAGTLRPIVDRTYPLEETPEALRRIARGSALGKLVIVI
jgi:NADPH:quinone reductase-like Zn-dependent oxidoreductase